MCMQVMKQHLELDMEQETGYKSGKESVKAAVSCHPAHLTYEYQTTLAASWEICMQVKKQQLEPYMEQLTGPNWESSTLRLYIVTLLI